MTQIVSSTPIKSDIQNKQATLLLWYVLDASLSAYQKLMHAFGDAHTALASHQQWSEYKIHKNHIARAEDGASMDAFLHMVNRQVQAGMYDYVVIGDDNYPKALLSLYDPPAVLFYKGDILCLNAPQLAVVGTRKPSEYAQKITFDLAQYFVQADFFITSGLADGVDACAHLGAFVNNRAHTIGVMGTGIDIVYPKKHFGLFDKIEQGGGCLISELLPSTAAMRHTFPRRNRIVAALASATIVTEAAINSGSLITARLSAELGKQVFVVPGQIDTAAAEGCHHLIREGATLIYHPQQVIDELRSPNMIIPNMFSQSQSLYQNIADKSTKQSVNTQSDTGLSATGISINKVDIPPHLQAVYDVLDKDAKDLDALVVQSGLDIATLLTALTELEILGAVLQTGGRYGKIA